MSVSGLTFTATQLGLGRSALLFIFVISPLLASCGWHLRGIEPVPEHLRSLQFETSSTTSEFVLLLRRALRTNEIELVNKQQQAPIRLSVDRVNNTRRTISTNNRGKAAEYELVSTVRYEAFNRSGVRVMGPTTLSSEKIYVFDENNVAGAVEEEQLLRTEMQRELVQQLLRRYLSLTPEVLDN